MGTYVTNTGLMATYGDSLRLPKVILLLQHNFHETPPAICMKSTVLNTISAVDIHRSVPVTPYSLNRRFCFSVISALPC